MAEMGVVNDYLEMNVDPTAIVHDPSHSLFLQPERISIAAHSRIDSMVRLQGGEGLEIGKHVHVASFCTIGAGGGKVIMEDHSGCSNGVVIASGHPDLSFRHISAADAPEDLHPVHKVTMIGRYVVIFANATICPGVSIGDYAVVGAGAVVTKNVPAYAIVMGVPARVVGYRRMGMADRMETVYLPKLRDLAATRDVERVREHFGADMPEELAVSLINFVTELS